jgi:hypothetical protein
VPNGGSAIEFNVGGFDNELAAARHRIPCVHCQIHDHLFDLPAVCTHITQMVSQPQFCLDVFSQQTGQYLPKVAYHRI